MSWREIKKRIETNISNVEIGCRLPDNSASFGPSPLPLPHRRQYQYNHHYKKDNLVKSNVIELICNRLIDGECIDGLWKTIGCWLYDSSAYPALPSFPIGANSETNNYVNDS